ncbi:MAG: RpiB/LacA/LacB family sugar-phosphate isomerase [Patescibacteria group bacterium]|nr:RpiB/LacA/LacB family sugar-phosphate isomerase [Patescibacteria group bacterium]
MIYLGADHGGFELKERIKEWLSTWGEQYEDCGAVTFDPNDDYPKYAFAVAEKVSWENRKGILVCRSSGGVVIAANKVQGIRAVACWDELSARHAREHNDANIIALAGDWINEDTAKKIVHVFLSTPFSNEDRHVRRINQITEYELQKDWTTGCCDGSSCCCDNEK